MLLKVWLAYSVLLLSVSLVPLGAGTAFSIASIVRVVGTVPSIAVVAVVVAVVVADDEDVVVADDEDVGGGCRCFSENSGVGGGGG